MRAHPIKTFFLAAVASIAMSGLLRAADESAPADLDPILRSLIEKHDVPGAVGAIVQGDRVVALGSAGVRKLGAPPAFEATDVIHLGSDTKAMTAMLIAQLIDQKKLAFDTPMREVFPDLADAMDPAMAKVTVRDLLDHTSGLAANLDWWALNAGKADLRAKRRRAVAKALSAPPASSVGKFAYSNVGYVVLGAIVEAKTKKPWEEVVRRELFEPLEMKTGGFGPPGTIGKIDEPWGHIRAGGKIKPTQVDNPPIMGPAGRVHCSAGDWCKFIAEILRGAGGRPRLVSAETFQELTTPIAKRTYAGGWIVAERPWAGGVVFTHSGSNTAWFCTVWIAPRKDFAVLIAANYGSDPIAAVIDEGIGKLIEFHAGMKADR
jgi:CubicO group peptidase (beta-lactamase class C family)